MARYKRYLATFYFNYFFLCRLCGLLVLLQMAIPIPVLAYHFFYMPSGGTFLPGKWQTLPVNFVVDNGPTDILPEIQTAVDTWNNVATAQDVLGTLTRATVDLTGANYLTAWGNLTGDGQQEVIFDEDGTAFAAVGLNPSAVNGYGPSNLVIQGGQAVITDAFLLLNGTRTNFDRQSTEVHELGHIQGLAHSSVGMHNSASFPSNALDPINVNAVPTMHPFSVAGAARRTLEADDIAAISELYPVGGFTFGSSIEGTITRCFSNNSVTGANVRAINISNPNVQISRFSGFDGNNQGRYVMRFLPTGSYRLVVEPMGANDFTINRFGSPPVQAEADFPTEYYNPPQEDDCTEELPDSAVNISVSAGSAALNRNLKVGAIDLAFVVDDTGSMSNEISAVRSVLSTFVTIMSNLTDILGIPFPNTAIVTFKDNVTQRLVSNDPTRLQTVISSLFASGGGDCPESSNAALLAAGRLLRNGGVAMLFTDADSRSNGPDRNTVTQLYRSKSLTLSTLLSGTCAGLSPPASENIACGPSTIKGVGIAAAEEFPPPQTLGFENAVRTFSEISVETGGFFTAIPGIKTGNTTERQRYINTGTNIAVSSVSPAIGLVFPGDAPQGTTLNIEITGANTNFQSSSLVSFSETGITVNTLNINSSESITANITVAPDAPLGFRDVTVTTVLGGGRTEMATGIGAFQVVSPPFGPTIISVVPSRGIQGGTIDISITGANTNFTNGLSIADFGSGITVNSTTVLTGTSAVVIGSKFEKSASFFHCCSA